MISSVYSVWMLWNWIDIMALNPYLTGEKYMSQATYLCGVC